MASGNSPSFRVAGTCLAGSVVRRHSMTKVITRAAILTGAILVTNVAVESAAPVTPVRAAVARVTRQITVPAGTVLRLRLTRGFGSDSRVEAPVSATLLSPVVVGGRAVFSGGGGGAGDVAGGSPPPRGE